MATLKICNKEIYSNPNIMQSFLSSQLPRLTIGLIAVSIIVALASNLGSSIDTLEPLFITFYYNQGLPEIRTGVVLWNDPDIEVNWPMDDVMLSERDVNNLKWADVPAELRPR